MKDEFSLVQLSSGHVFHVGCCIWGRYHEASSIHPVPRICSQLQSATHWKKPAISPTFRQNHGEFRLSLVISNFHSRFLWTFFHWHSAHSAHSAFSFVSIVPERSAIRSLWLPKWSYSARLTWKTRRRGGVYHYFILIPRFFGKSHTNMWSKTQKPY